VRFYLMFGHHRKRLNFTAESFREVSKRLDNLRAILQEIGGASPGKVQATTSYKTTQDLIAALVNRFEKNMDDDLNVRGAVDGLVGTLARLAALKRSGRLNAQDCLDIDQKMRRIDSVLQLFYPPSFA
jgi:cysteinyl-tRNA synthetase